MVLYLKWCLLLQAFGETCFSLIVPTARILDKSNFPPPPSPPPPPPLPSAKRAGGTIRRGKYLNRTAPLDAFRLNLQIVEGQESKLSRL